ncbi:hypothetical protein AURDEDRAFT_181147 [Auricularia subglabra TFB-10046 SS5]|nr:hypothetical protein AURDEDRAFT_181147 [Auricularia subglabra TFB-10046 SS5]
MAIPREMIKHQSALVDTCWEEDAYAAAITMLDQLRATGTKPPIEHVRILVFLALHPPAQERKKRGPAATKTKGRKRRAGRGDEDEVLQPPTAGECGAALDLLTAYTLTLAPAHVLRALPSHLQRAEADPDVDSAVGKRALVLARPKDCPDVWAMLREGFVSDPTIPREGNHEEDVRAPVGPHAWRMLDWLVGVFEDDAREWFAQEKPADVPLFLAQISQQRLSGARNAPLWDTRTPVNVALHCFEVDDADGELPFSAHERMVLGARLLRIMIDMTIPKENHPVLLEPLNLLRNVLRRLPGLHSDAFDTLFRMLALDAPHFAISLLFQYLGASNPSGPVDICALLAMPPPAKAKDCSKHAHAKGHLISALARADPNAAKNNALRTAIDRAFAPDMLTPTGVVVDDETVRDAQRWRDQLVLLLDCVGR